MSAPRQKVVAVGAGFGGLNAVHALAKAPVDIALIDRNNHHLFQPLLYQVATAALASSDIAAPVPYDLLVLATGAVSTWFGHDDWAEHSVGLKSLENAETLRFRLLGAFEQAESRSDHAGSAAKSHLRSAQAQRNRLVCAPQPDEIRRLLTFVVVGGAPVAKQQGRYVAGVIAARANGAAAPGPFRYRDQGSLAIIGRSSAVASLPHLKLAGFPAWLLWSGVHLFLLVGLQNRIMVYVQWVSAYLFSTRGARLMWRAGSGVRAAIEESLSYVAGRGVYWFRFTLNASACAASLVNGEFRCIRQSRQVWLW